MMHPFMMIFYLTLLNLVVSFPSNVNTRICRSATWNRQGITVAGGNGLGSGLNQLYSPNGIFISDDGSIYVSDTNNNRVVKWTIGQPNGQIVVGLNQQQKLGQITKAVVDRNGNIFVCDRDNNRVLKFTQVNSTGEIIVENISCWGLALDQQDSLYVSDLNQNLVRKWPTNEIVAGGNGQGNAINQLSAPYQLFVDSNQTIFIADRGNNRVMKWNRDAKQGMMAFPSQGYGNADDQLYKPMGVTVDQMGTMYVVEYINLRVMRWFQTETQGHLIIGGQGYGIRPDQLYFPRDLAFDLQGNLYVADTNNHRIQMFTIDTTSCSNN